MLLISNAFQFLKIRAVDFPKWGPCFKIKYNNFSLKNLDFYFKCANNLLHLHLFVISARRAFSEEKVSSKSNSSRAGGGNSLKAGGKTLQRKSSMVDCHVFLILYTPLRQQFLNLYWTWRNHLKSQKQLQSHQTKGHHLKIPFLCCKHNWIFKNSLVTYMPELSPSTTTRHS